MDKTHMVLYKSVCTKKIYWNSFLIQSLNRLDGGISSQTKKKKKKTVEKMFFFNKFWCFICVVGVVLSPLNTHIQMDFLKNCDTINI